MRIVIDLQGVQGDSRKRGIGRYTLSLAQAMVRNRGDHEILLALNGMFPESIEPIRAAFYGLLPQENIRVWQAVSPVHPLDQLNEWRRHVAELTREAFLISLNADIVHVTSLFEGFIDDAVHSIGLAPHSLPTAVTIYDLIPLIQSEYYLQPNPTYNNFYYEKLDHLMRADLCLTISESSRHEVAGYFSDLSNKAVNIAAAADENFKPICISNFEKNNIFLRYGINRKFIMNSGAADVRKNHLRLIEAFSLLPYDLRKNYQLVIAGGLSGERKFEFEKHAEMCGLETIDLIITDRVTDKEMLQLYNLCELYVFPSWHEGFGLPALEAMSCGAPVIGSNTTSIPEVIGRLDALFDPFDVNDISSKMAEVLENEDFRCELAKHGIERSKIFNWDKTAICALNALEQFVSNHRKRAIDNNHLNRSITEWLVDKVVNLTDQKVDDIDLQKISLAVAQNHYQSTERQLLVDISELSQRDHRTGIQRVVRSVLAELLVNPPSGFRVEPIYALPNEPNYRYARKFSQSFGYSKNNFIEDEIVEFGRGDIFLGLDLQHHVVIQHYNFYNKLKKIGVEVHFVVYDLLPVLLPHAFPEDTPNYHYKWLEILAQSDGVLCISRSVADEMKEWLSVFGPVRLRPLKLGWFHLGGDVSCSVPSIGLPKDSDLLLRKLSSRPTFLMVGTIEPRKGQLQTLLSFDKLWAQGIDVNLVIVGKHGWNVDFLVNMLRTHNENNRRLFWLDGISDEYLEKIYTASVCLIAASEGEGFGLPLIEAAQHKIPIIARDIPVFREVAGKYAYYFSGLHPESLARAVRDWLVLNECGEAPNSDSMPWLTWKESTQNLLAVLLGGQWYQEWIPDNVHRFWGGDHRLETQVGRRIGREIVSTGTAGCLIYGPYLSLAAGHYRIIVRGRVEKIGISAPNFDIAVQHGQLILAESRLDSYCLDGVVANVSVILNTACNDLEVRIWASDGCELLVSMIEIEPLQEVATD